MAVGARKYSRTFLAQYVDIYNTSRHSVPQVLTATVILSFRQPNDNGVGDGDYMEKEQDTWHKPLTILSESS